MASVTKSLLVNLGVFLADNGLRRSVGTYTYNFTSPTASSNTNTFTLNPGQVLTWTNPLTSSVLTIISASGPLRADLTLRPSGSYSLLSTRLHTVDSDVGQVVLENVSLTDAIQVTIIQC